MILCGLLGWLPRVKASTKGEGTERRYFYGTVWAVSIARARARDFVEDFTAQFDDGRN